MTRLETRYRRLLGLLPAWYRAEREQEMVEVFLDDRAARARDTGELDAEYGWPGWGESVAVAGLAVHTRVGGPNDPSGPRAVGDVVRSAAAGAVLLNAGTAAAVLVWSVLAALVGPSAAATHLQELLHPTGGSEWVRAIAVALELCWLPTWTALAAGRARLALLLALAATAPVLASLVASVVEDPPGLVSMVLARALLPVLAVALLALGHHRDAPAPVVARPWSLLVATFAALLAAAPLSLLLATEFRPESAVVLLAAAVAVVAGRRGPSAGGVAVLGAAVVVGGLLELSVVAVANSHSGPVLTSVLGLVAMLIAVPAARRRDRATSPTPG